MNKRRILRALSLVLVAVIALTASFAVAGGNEAVRPQDDLYAAVNAEWLAAAEIPANKIMVGGFADLTDEVEERLMADFAAMSEETAAQFETLPEFLKFYAMAADYDARNAQGAQPLAPYLAEIEALNSLADLNAALPGLILRGMPAPVNAGVMADMGDARYYALYFVEPSLFLPGVSFYGTPTGDYLLDVFGQVLGALLQQCGYGEEEAAQIVAQALAFDALIKPYMRPDEEARHYDKMYNPTPLADFAAYSSALDLAGLVEALVPASPEKVVVLNPNYYGALEQVLTEEHFPLVKGWMLARMAAQYAGMLSQEMAATAAAYEMILTGQAEMDDPQKLAYRLAESAFSEPVGLYYAHTYFSAEAKQDVTAMVEQLMEVYKGRFQTNDWLSEETVQGALRKLEHMSLQIGYPDELNPIYALFTIVPTEEGGSVLSNMMGITRIVVEDNFSRCGQEHDPTEWGTSAATVNAYFNALTNTITFPAAILQEPFYSPDYSASRNLGSIGAIIGHEITHAFDTSGAMFDEYGSLNNWWTEADFAAFEQKCEAFVAQFDGLLYEGIPINGRQVITEVVGDAGGLSSALEVCQALPDADARAFFEGWATIWRSKLRPEFLELILTISAYPPDSLRVNMQVNNLDAFYAAFDVQEGDGMYLAPEERVAVW